MKSVNTLHRALMSTSCMGIALGMASVASAQVDTIVVTAEKKEENVQDVGLSIQAFDKEGLDRAGIEDVSRLEFLVSGVNFAFVGNDAKFNVRGANSTQTFADNSSIVGAFVDGVYKARASQQTRSFFDVSRVEFLKGPQGTLYGRNTFAGALNLYTNAPDLEEYSAGVSGSYERFDRTKFEAYANLPVSDTFALRVAGFYDRGNGYIENLAGPDIGAPDDRGFRVSALWEPTDRINIVARYSNIQEDGIEAGLFGFTFTCRNVTPSGHTDPFGSQQDCANPQPGSGGLPNVANFDPFTVELDFVPEGETNEQVVSLEANFDLGPVLVKSISSYTDFLISAQIRSRQAVSMKRLSLILRKFNSARIMTAACNGRQALIIRTTTRTSISLFITSVRLLLAVRMLLFLIMLAIRYLTIWVISCFCRCLRERRWLATIQCSAVSSRITSL